MCVGVCMCVCGCVGVCAPSDGMVSFFLACWIANVENLVFVTFQLIVLRTTLIYFVILFYVAQFGPYCYGGTLPQEPHLSSNQKTEKIAGIVAMKFIY